MNLTAFRTSNPEYDSYSDDELSSALDVVYGKQETEPSPAFDLPTFRKNNPEYDSYGDEELTSALGTVFGSESQEPAEDYEEAGILDRVKDTGIDVVKGATGLGKSVVGMGSFVTGGLIGKGMESIGYDPDETNRIVSEGYSEERKHEEKQVEEAEGFTGTIKELADNPSVILGKTIETLPLMFGNVAVSMKFAKAANIAAKEAALARGLSEKAAAKIGRQAGVAAGTKSAAIGEGAQQTGMSFDDYMREGMDYGTAYAASAGSGVTTAGIAFFGGGLGKKLGLGDASAGIVGRESDGVAKRFIKGGVQESVFEETGQSVTETMWDNYAHDKPLDEGIGKAAGMGTVIGFAAGGGMSALNSGHSGEAPTAKELLNQNNKIIKALSSAETDPQEREQAIIMVAEKFNRDDPDLAKQWIAFAMPYANNNEPINTDLFVQSQARTEEDILNPNNTIDQSIEDMETVAGSVNEAETPEQQQEDANEALIDELDGQLADMEERHANGEEVDQVEYQKIKTHLEDLMKGDSSVLPADDLVNEALNETPVEPLKTNKNGDVVYEKTAVPTAVEAAGLETADQAAAREGNYEGGIEYTGTDERTPAKSNDSVESSDIETRVNNLLAHVEKNPDGANRKILDEINSEGETNWRNVPEKDFPVWEAAAAKLKTPAEEVKTPEQIAKESQASRTSPGKTKRYKGLEGEKRILRQDHRDALKVMQGELHEGGGQMGNVVGGNNVEGAESIAADKIGESTTMASDNPEWFQAIHAELGDVSIKNVKAAIDKALNAEPLGVGEARYITALLDEITGFRTDPANIVSAKKARDRAKVNRKIGHSSDFMDEYENEAGEIYEESHYDPTWDADARSLSEIYNQAAEIDEAAAQEIMEGGKKDRQVVSELFAIIEGNHENKQPNKKADSPAAEVKPTRSEKPAEEKGEVDGQAKAKDTAPAQEEKPAPKLSKGTVVQVKGYDRKYTVVKSRLDTHWLEPVELSSQEKAAGFSKEDRRLKVKDYELSQPQKEKPATELTLDQQSPEDIKKQEADRKAAIEAEKEAENKQKADKEVDEFTLTGSDREADLAAAAGQETLFQQEPAGTPLNLINIEIEYELPDGSVKMGKQKAGELLAKTDKDIDGVKSLISCLL